MKSPSNQLQIKKRVSYHIGQVTSDFKREKMDEAYVESLDENVKYADVASGGVGMNMVVRIRGGKFARLEPAFVIFQNESRFVAYQTMFQAWSIGPDSKDGWTSK